MNIKEKMHQIAAAIVETNDRIRLIETTRYTTNANREELKRLRRVVRALERDIEQLAATLPHPVQFNFFAAVDERNTNDPFDVKGELRDYPSNLSADGRPTLSREE